MPSFFQHVAGVPLRLYAKVFLSLQIRGIKNIDTVKGAAIIASNHVSELDPLLIVACLPFFSRHLPLIFVSREKSFYSFGRDWRTLVYGGALFRMIGGYQAYVGLKNYDQALQHHLEAIRNGNSVCIFPTGQIHRKVEPNKAKGGVSFLAQQTQLPIIPVLIQNKGAVSVTFGRPLYAKDLFRDTSAIVNDDTRNDYEDAATVLMEKINQLA